MSDEDSQNYVIQGRTKTFNARNANADFVNRSEAKFQAEQNRDLASKLIDLQKTENKFRGYNNRFGYEMIKEEVLNGQSKRPTDGR